MLLIAPPPAHSGFPGDHSVSHQTKAAQKANTSLLPRHSDTKEGGRKSDTTPLFAEIKTCCILFLLPILFPLEVTLHCTCQWTLFPFSDAHKICFIISASHCLDVFVAFLVMLCVADQTWHTVNAQGYLMLCLPCDMGIKLVMWLELLPALKK